MTRLQVRFLQPLEDDGGKDFFNVFVLHQVSTGGAPGYGGSFGSAG